MTTPVLSARGGSFARLCLKKRISESGSCAQSFKIVESPSLFVDSVIRIHVSMSCYRTTIRNGVAADANPLIQIHRLEQKESHCWFRQERGSEWLKGRIQCLNGVVGKYHGRGEQQVAELKVVSGDYIK